MAIVTVGDILKHAQRFEEELADYYRAVSEKSKREGVRMLADYMSRHRIRPNEALAKLPTDMVRRISSEPLRYDPEVASCRCFEGIDLPPGATAQEVLNVALRLDRCLISLYRQAAAQTGDEQVRSLLESLIAREELDEVELQKIKASNYF